MTNDEIQALRRIPAILGKASTPEERRTIALRIEALVTGQDNAPLAYSLRHLAALFFPSDEVRARDTLQRLNADFDTGELVTRIPREHRHVMLSDVAAWPNCPPMAADSPLRYWLSNAPQAAVPEETAAEMGARHWQACLDAGLEMPTDTYAQYPRGITRIAQREGVKRQTFAKRLDAYRAEKFSR